MVKICLLELYCMPQGSWADWFSGIASTCAVIVALFGYIYLYFKDKKEKQKVEERIANEIGVRIAKLSVDVLRNHKHLFEEFNDKEKCKRKKWGEITPRIGYKHPDIKELTSAEEMLLISMGQAKYLTEISRCMDCNNGLNIAIDEFSTIKNNFYENYGIYINEFNEIGEINIPTEMKYGFEQHIKKMKHYSKIMQEMSEQNIVIIENICASYHMTMKSMMPNGKFIKIDSFPIS